MDKEERYFSHTKHQESIMYENRKKLEENALVTPTYIDPRIETFLYRYFCTRCKFHGEFLFFIDDRTVCYSRTDNVFNYLSTNSDLMKRLDSTNFIDHLYVWAYTLIKTCYVKHMHDGYWKCDSHTSKLQVYLWNHFGIKVSFTKDEEFKVLNGNLIYKGQLDNSEFAIVKQKDFNKTVAIFDRDSTARQIIDEIIKAYIESTIYIAPNTHEETL